MSRDPTTVIPNRVLLAIVVVLQVLLLHASLAAKAKSLCIRLVHPPSILAQGFELTLVRPYLRMDS